MDRRRLAVAAVLGLCAGALPALAQSAEGAAATPFRVPSGAHLSARTHVARGIDTWTLTWRNRRLPERSNLLSVDLSRPGVRAGVYVAHRVLNGRFEPLRHMLTGSGAVAGINGDFFDLFSMSGPPRGGVVRGGVVLKSPRPHFAANLFVGADGRARIGPASFTGTVAVAPRVTRPLYSVNTVGDAAAGRLTLLTGTLDGTRLPGRAALVLATRNRSGGYTVTRVVRGVRPGSYLSRLPAGQVALVAAGAGGQWLRAHVARGRTLRISTRVSGPGGTVQTLLSGAQQLLRAGEPVYDSTGRHVGGRNAETFVCVARDGRHLLAGTVDQYEYLTRERGVSLAELRTFLRGLGCYDALALDGGGSSTLDYRTPRHRIVTANHPADGAERWLPDALLFWSAG